MARIVWSDELQEQGARIRAELRSGQDVTVMAMETQYEIDRNYCRNYPWGGGSASL